MARISQRNCHDLTIDVRADVLSFDLGSVEYVPKALIE